MIQIYLIRHGECEGSGSYIGRGSDVLLTDSGRDQIHNLVDMLKIKFDFIYTSTMKRCLLTTGILSKLQPSKIVETKILEEIDFGEWEGRTYSYLQENHEKLYNNWIHNPINSSPPGGESLVDLQKRVLEIVPELLEFINDDKIWNIAIVSHKGPLSILLLYLMKLDLSYFWKFRIDRGSVSKLKLYSDFSELEFLNYLPNKQIK